MSGMVFCRFCDYSSSAWNMLEHETWCQNNPAAQAPTPPAKPGHVASDHFLHQFNECDESDARLRAMAAHCAYLFNQLADEKALRLAAYNDIVDRLAAANPLTELALSLSVTIHDMKDD